MKKVERRADKGFEFWANVEFAEMSVFKNVGSGVELPLLLKVLQNVPRPVVVIFPLLSDAESAAVQLPLWGDALGEGVDFSVVPETLSGGKFIPESEALRARVIHSALYDKSSLFIGSVSGFFSAIPDPDMIVSSSFKVRAGDKISQNLLITQLLEMDYDDELEAGLPGEYSKRGGIIDIFSPISDYPARLEFFGDTIESIRLYSPESQRTFREIKEYHIIPRSAMENSGDGPLFIDAFRVKKPFIITIFPERCREHLIRFGGENSLEVWDRIYSDKNMKGIRFLDSAESDEFRNGGDCGIRRTTELIHGDNIPDSQDSLYSEWRKQLTVERVRQWLDTGYEVTISGSLDSSDNHIKAWCHENGVDSDRVDIKNFNLPFGITMLREKRVIITEKELFTSIKHHHSMTAPPLKKRKIDILDAAPGERGEFSTLEQGDYAVHLDYGICLYHGITEIYQNRAKQEMFKLEFADEVIVYIPLFQANLLSKYIGSKKDLPTLNKKGGQRWLSSKIEASKDIRDMAIELLSVQAMRMKNRGYAFRQDDLWQYIFEESFPFQATPDQTKATAEIKDDMSSKRPMDRLLCGDVGYGKTEVAMRAAFKAVMDGKQVAVMVPTTILAQQHYYTFKDRFVEHPIIIDMLSRFRTASEQRASLGKLKEGKVDIIIGTHRLVQKDVEFANLGLVIIDEEQRFGVGHKEKLKQFRATVDVLTMTATPIPRTLYMSMTGLRDLSTITTPPNARVPVRSYVCKEDMKVAADAIREEIQRGGQVYYLHNRVKTIHQRCRDLQELVPDAKFAVGHGRMDEHELEEVMGDFLEGNTDVLVCTTIIESGLDIPNANTIIIERADRFGLSELYQLRGRVGRWHRQAYAYMFLPKDQILTGNARKRISAIRRYSELGSGFRLALRDLEIRGAGNLLGAKQSGHINAIGFDLYCQLLRAAVDEQKGKNASFAPSVQINIDFIVFAAEAPEGMLPATLPEFYIPSETQRVSFYKRIGNLNTFAELKSIEAELIDRYGEIPYQVRNFLSIAEIRIRVIRAGQRSLNVKNKKVILQANTKVVKINGLIPTLTSDTPSRQLREIKEILKKIVSYSGKP
jgi:transcription-repair coupling factor (superfamily II helicase)